MASRHTRDCVARGFQVRGENVYPTEIDNYLRTVDGYGGEHRVVVSRRGSMDELLVRVEGERGESDGFQKTVADGLQSLLGVRADVEVVEPDTFDRSDHKSQRVTDEREHTRRGGGHDEGDG